MTTDLCHIYMYLFAVLPTTEWCSFCPYDNGYSVGQYKYVCIIYKLLNSETNDSYCKVH